MLFPHAQAAGLPAGITLDFSITALSYSASKWGPRPELALEPWTWVARMRLIKARSKAAPEAVTTASWDRKVIHQPALGKILLSVCQIAEYLLTWQSDRILLEPVMH